MMHINRRRRRETTGLIGLWDIKVHELEKGTEFYLVKQRKNLVIPAGRNLVRDFLYGDEVTGLTHMAVGTSATDPAVSVDIGEVYRKAITDRVKASGQLTIDMYLAGNEANGNTLTAVALWGNGATDTAGTGTQYNKLLHTGVQAIEKTESIAVTYTCDLYFVAG